MYVYLLNEGNRYCPVLASSCFFQSIHIIGQFHQSMSVGLDVMEDGFPGQYKILHENTYIRFRRTIPGGCALAQFHPKTHDDRR